MKFYFNHPQLEKQIKEILNKIMLSMNGVASDKMKEYGLDYGKNYGVSIVRLKEIARMYHSDYDLSVRLWALDIREAKIIATMLMPVEKLSIQTAEKWIEEIDNSELIEQVCLNLFSKTPYAKDLIKNWISQDNLYKNISAFLITARIYDQLQKEEIEKIVIQVISCSNTQNNSLCKYITRCLSRLARHSSEIRIFILSEINKVEKMNTENTCQQYIIEEVKEEILFLEDSNS